ncbi:hypothetical protein [Leptolyngbya sp. O-77]|nr:hypothetical protein [Leptolyngbya sp. O-77]
MNPLRVVCLYFDSWEHLLTFMLHGLELHISPSTTRPVSTEPPS